MCGRFSLSTPPEQIARQFRLTTTPSVTPHYNIAPTQNVSAIRTTDAGRQLAALRWGLIPAWADDAKIGNRMINARSETAATSPAFRRAFRERRCLIVADGFFEWQKVDAKTKQPFFIRLEDDAPFGFAGLWEAWRGPDGAVVESCTILTTTPNELVSAVHDRMPVLLPPTAYDTWLDPQQNDVATLQALLAPYPAEEMMAYPVTTLVNSPRNDGAELVAPLG